MKQKVKKLITFMCIAFGVLCLAQTNVHAEWVRDTENDVSYEDEVLITSGVAYEYLNGAAGYSYIIVGNEGDRITNVRSSSKNLIAKITEQELCTWTGTEWDYETSQNITTTSSYYDSFRVGFFAKKSGSYTVFFDLVDAAGKVKCTKAIKVNATKAKTVLKYIKYCGKDIYEYYPYAAKKSGKLSVKPAKGYALVSIEVGTRDSRGKIKYKKVKNNKKIKLATSEKYEYENGYTIEQYDDLFPLTRICVTVKNKKTKEVTKVYYDLYTMNAK